MARRHRKPARLSPKARRTWLGVAMLAVLGPIAGVALGSAIDDVRDCTETVTLSVGVHVGIAPLLEEHAADWSRTGVPVDGVCVSVDVTAVDSASAAAHFADAFGVDVDLGDVATDEIGDIDVWVPESTTWSSRFGSDVGTVFLDRLDSVATASLGLAVPQGNVDDVTGSLAETPVRLADPRSDAGSLAVMIASGGAVPFTPVVAEDGYRVASLPEVLAENTDGGEPSMFVDTIPPLPAFDYPLLVRADAEKPVVVAADAFRSSLLGKDFTERLADHGFTEAGPYPQRPDPSVVEAAIAAWDAL